MQTQHLIHSLANCGIDTFFIAPGSRNYELIEAARSIEGISSHVHYDERGLSFFALGYAIATNKIAPIIVTSGTAVGLLLPAVMEAFHSGIPLLLITADRPLSLYGTGANQTCDQRGIFSHFTKLAIDLDLTEPNRFDPDEVALKVLKTGVETPGPIHLNCHLKAPKPVSFPRIKVERKDLPLPKEAFNLDIEIDSFLDDPNALLLIGRNFFLSDLDLLKGKQISSSCTVITDLLSGCRGLFANEVPLKKFLQNPPSHQRVLHLGGSFIDTGILNYLEKASLTEYIEISPPSLFFDPHRKVTKHIPSSPWNLLHTLAKAKGIPALNSTPYNAEISSQASFLKGLLLKEEDAPIYVSNSSLIRDLDLSYYPIGLQYPIYSNRGLSGSEGNLATFAGFAFGLKKKTLGLLGDIALLHDISSIPLLSQLNHEANLFVFNNQGGDIFRRLPHTKSSSSLETHFATRHNYNLCQMIQSYGFACNSIQDLTDLQGDYGSMIKIWEVCLAKEEEKMPALLS